MFYRAGFSTGESEEQKQRGQYCVFVDANDVLNQAPHQSLMAFKAKNADATSIMQHATRKPKAKAYANPLTAGSVPGSQQPAQTPHTPP